MCYSAHSKIQEWRCVHACVQRTIDLYANSLKKKQNNSSKSITLSSHTMSIDILQYNTYYTLHTRHIHMVHTYYRTRLQNYAESIIITISTARFDRQRISTKAQHDPWIQFDSCLIYIIAKSKLERKKMKMESGCNFSFRK